MSFQFGSSDSEQRQEAQQQQTQAGTTQVVIPPTPTSAAAEELTQLNLQIARQQIAAQQRALADSEAFAASPLGQRQRQLEETVTNNLLARMNGTAPVLSPEAQGRIDTAFNARRTEGLRDINRTFEEDAAARGLNVTDSPIANAKGLALADFLRGLESAKATSSLNVGDTEANFNQALAQFQAGLRQQAALNRLALAGNAPASFGLQQSLFGQGLATGQRQMSGNLFGTGSRSGTGNMSAFGFGLNGQQAGGFLQGLAGLGA